MELDGICRWCGATGRTYSLHQHKPGLSIEERYRLMLWCQVLKVSV